MGKIFAAATVAILGIIAVAPQARAFTIQDPNTSETGGTLQLADPDQKMHFKDGSSTAPTQKPGVFDLGNGSSLSFSVTGGRNGYSPSFFGPTQRAFRPPEPYVSSMPPNGDNN